MCKFAIVPFDDLFLAATLQFSHCLQSMPLQRRLREAVRVDGNSAQGRCLALGFQETRKPGPHFNRVPGPQKVYFNHWLCVLLMHCL